MAQEGMFWEFVPEDVIGVPAELTSAGCGCEWRVKKDNMEKARGGTWRKFDWECKAATVKRARTKGIL